VRSTVDYPFIAPGLQFGQYRVLKVALDAFVADENIFDGRAIENEKSFRCWGTERLRDSIKHGDVSASR
jgi:hypothetical protein